jgi:hypothetical protein
MKKTEKNTRMKINSKINWTNETKSPNLVFKSFKQFSRDLQKRTSHSSLLVSYKKKLGNCLLIFHDDENSTKFSTILNLSLLVFCSFFYSINSFALCTFLLSTMNVNILYRKKRREVRQQQKFKSKAWTSRYQYFFF